jgi:1-acyl-sn-glycerol-3-phosphate acyltransferase
MRDSFLYGFARVLIFLFANLYFRIEAHGTANVPSSGAAILAANHASDVDPPLVALALPRQCHFLAKEELFRIPVLGWFIRKVHSHPVQRGAMDRKALRICAEVLNAGKLLILFPEGTRTRDGELQPARPGFSLIAAQSDVPIVPVYMEGSFRVMPRGAHFPRPRKLRVYYGKPFRVAELPAAATGRERHVIAAKEIMRRIAELKREAEKTS